MGKRKRDEIEYLREFSDWKNSNDAKEIEKYWLDGQISKEYRAKLFQKIPIGLIEKYSWAIPDERAIEIVKCFAPIVEIGAGNGYWAKLIKDRGVDIIAFDLFTAGAKGNWTSVEKGGPEVLKKFKGRAMMLCYPDDYEHSLKPLSMRCLKEYKGDTIILVGEVFSKTILESPWGKSFNEEFQQELAASFYKVIEYALPSWPTSVDSISVWKRKKFCQVDDDVRIAIVPPEESIFKCSYACSKYAHLLN